MSRKYPVSVARACYKAILAFGNQGACSEAEHQAIEHGYDMVMTMIHEISFAARSKKKAACGDLAKKVLHGLHPRIDYSYDERLIRDLADICLTLRHIMDGKPRKDVHKVYDACCFFQFFPMVATS